MKRAVIVLLLLAVLTAAAGCAGGNDKRGGGALAEPIVYIVSLCYVNYEYVLTGNEDLPPLYIYDNQHMICYEGEQYFTVLDRELRDDALGIGGVTTVITDKIQFNSVAVKGGAAFVDLKGDSLSGGSLEEGLLISQIVNTLRRSFEEIERVQFMVDGNVPETLMGHYDISNPYETGIHSIENQDK